MCATALSQQLVQALMDRVAFNALYFQLLHQASVKKIYPHITSVKHTPKNISKFRNAGKGQTVFSTLIPVSQMCPAFIPVTQLH